MTAKFILTKSVLLDYYTRLVSNDWLVTYSVKTNPQVGRVLDQETNCDFSIQHLDELKYLSKTEHVWYLAQSMTPSTAQKVIDAKVTKFVIENEQDLNALLQVLERNASIQVDLMLRMKIREHTIFTGKYYVFGMDSKTVNTKIGELYNNPQINSIGLHFHRKTQNVSEWDIIDELADSIEPENWQHITTVNIGGGFPARYKNITDSSINSVFAKVKGVQKWLVQHDVKLMVEPGRYLAAPCIELHTTITAVHGRNIIIDASVYNSAMDTLLVPIKLLVKDEQENGEKYLIRGCTPCSMDIFRYDVRLYKSPQVGDTLVFLNAGAYNFSTNFCELATPETEVR